MIKKVFFVSLILFFILAGNVSAIDLPVGNIFGDDQVPIPIVEIVPPESYPVFTYLLIKDDLGSWIFNDGQLITCYDPFIGTWSELLGVDYTSYLDRTFYLQNTTCGLWDSCAFNSSEVVLRDVGWYLPVLSMPETASSDLLANVGGLFTDFWPIITIMIGIPLAFYIIPRVIELVVVRDKS